MPKESTPKLRILVVDDIPLMRTILRKYIGLISSQHFAGDSEAIEVLEAKNGVEALEIISSKKVDAIFLDLMMPELSGTNFLEEKRENNLLADIPVFITTALDDEVGREETSVLGAVKYIRKPFTLKEVKEALRPFLPTHEENQKHFI